MKYAFAIALIIAALVAYDLLFPPSTFYFFDIPGGGTVTFSHKGVEFDPPPDHYATNGFDHIEPYISRLLVPSDRFKSLSIFTPDGHRGFGFNARNGVVAAGFTVDWRREGHRESAIRGFFSSLGITPSQDYLAGNGDVADAIRILEYPITGGTAEVTALTKRILQQLCGVSPTEALDIEYKDE